MKIKNLAGILLLVFFLSIFATQVTVADASPKEGLFPTKKESSVAINMTLNHDGLDATKNLPTLNMNTTYTLEVTVTVVKLGPDARNIHDIAILTEITRENFLGSKTYFHSGMFFDSKSNLKVGDSHVYTIEIMPLGTAERIEDAQLTVTISVKEDVQFLTDPTTEFTPLTYAIVLNPDGTAHDITSFYDGALVRKSVVSYAKKESQINFTLGVGVDSIDSETNKPQISSYTMYSLFFYVKVLKLGPDAKDVHDLDISISLDDESVVDYLPGHSTKQYFALNYAKEASLKESTTIMLHTAFYISSNINNTTVKFKIHTEVKEDVPLVDPTSTIADFSVEMNLNSTVSTKSPASFNSYMIIIAVALLPILRKRKFQ